MSVRIAYITTPLSEAEKIATHLLEKRLCACVNIIDKVQSLYWWEGKIEKTEEVLLMVKTLKDKAEALVEEVKKIHPYEVPEVIFTKVKGGNPDYLNWVKGECG